eukprot:1154015-Pelagomonas_calceolata.AAC.7
MQPEERAAVTSVSKLYALAHECTESVRQPVFSGPNQLIKRGIADSADENVRVYRRVLNKINASPICNYRQEDLEMTASLSA